MSTEMQGKEVTFKAMKATREHNYESMASISLTLQITHIIEFDC